MTKQPIFGSVTPGEIAVKTWETRNLKWKTIHTKVPAGC